MFACEQVHTQCLRGWLTFDGVEGLVCAVVRTCGDVSLCSEEVAEGLCVDVAVPILNCCDHCDARGCAPLARSIGALHRDEVLDAVLQHVRWYYGPAGKVVLKLFRHGSPTWSTIHEHMHEEHRDIGVDLC